MEPGHPVNLFHLLISLNFLYYSLQEATLNTLVAVEVLCWFFVGECIGKGSLVAYQV